MKLTAADYRKYPYHTESSIIGIKRIQALSTRYLKAIAEEQGDMLEKLRVRIGKDTNPNWVISQVAEELYERGAIEEVEFDLLTE